MIVTEGSRHASNGHLVGWYVAMHNPRPECGVATSRLISAFPHGGSAWLILTTLAALVAPVTLTLYAWRITSNNVASHNQGAFEALALESETALRHRLDSYENALLGANAYFLGSDFVSTREWQTYVCTLDIHKN